MTWQMQHSFRGCNGENTDLKCSAWRPEASLYSLLQMLEDNSLCLYNDMNEHNPFSRSSQLTADCSLNLFPNMDLTRRKVYSHTALWGRNAHYTAKNIVTENCWMKNAGIKTEKNRDNIAILSFLPLAGIVCKVWPEGGTIRKVFYLYSDHFRTSQDSGSGLHCQTWLNFPLSVLLYTVAEYSYFKGSLALRMPIGSMVGLLG